MAAPPSRSAVIAGTGGHPRLVLVIDGAVLIALLKLGRVYAGRRIQDDALSQAVQGALARGTSDLNAVAFWMMAYGIVVAAAAGALGSRARHLTPAVARERCSGWLARRRATTGGTVGLAVLGLVAGLLLIQNPVGSLTLLAVIAGLWLTYLSVLELVSADPPRAEDQVGAHAATGGRRTRNLLIGAGVGVVVLALMTAGVVVSTRRRPTPLPRASNGATGRRPSATSASIRSCSPAPTTPCRLRCTRAGSSASR
jgi:hypothetical protein